MKFKLADRDVYKDGRLHLLVWRRGDWSIRMERMQYWKARDRFHIRLSCKGRSGSLSPWLSVDRQTPALMLLLYFVNDLSMRFSDELVARWEDLARRFNWVSGAAKVPVPEWKIWEAYRKGRHEAGIC